MKNFFIYAGKIFSFLICITFFSCTNSFVENLNTSEIKVASSEIASPGNLTASNGDCKKITLSWDSVSNAKQYLIYSANSPYEDFVQIGETSGNVASFEYSVSAGTSLWFRVCSVSYLGEKSAMSSYVFGSSMAVPNITDVSLGTDGTSVTVVWWMNNCSSKTYQDSCIFEVTCYEEDKISVLGTYKASGSERSVEISGLKNRATYYYQVKAYIDGFNGETSDFADAETARLTTPSAPEDVSGEKGISTDEINVSWTLPEGVDVKVSSGIYNEHPLYFTVERKLLSEDDDSYTVLVPYVGTYNESADGIYFTCAENNVFTDSELKYGSLKVSIEDANSDDAVANYENYIPGAKLTYTDSTALRGKQYSYRIRSYADAVENKTVSSDLSVADCDAWLISNSVLETKYKYTEDSADETKFSSVDISFDFAFEDFSLDDENFYIYALTYARTAFESEAQDEEKVLKFFDSVEEINEFVKTCDSDFLSNEEKQGFYSFKIYICKNSVDKTSLEIPAAENYYYSVSASNTISITDDANKLPVINSFEVDDGFADKYVLTWDYNSSYSYTIYWIEYDGDSEQPLSEESESLSLTQTASDGTISLISGISTETKTETSSDGTSSEVTYATYTHSAQSGNARKYTLIAENGLQTAKTFDSVSKTLGTAQVSTKGLFYDSICVTWSQVQMAEDYELSAYYSSDDSKTELAVTTGDVVNTEISEENGIYSCVISKPEGYNSAIKSGSEIILTVTAKNEKDSTASQNSVRTFGPALIDASTGTLYENNININWNKIDGAAGYIIYRVLYSDRTADNSKIESSTDTYYFDVASSTLKRNGENPAEGTSVYLKNSRYYLNEIDDSDCLDEVSINQRKISWGRPFGYIILPVLTDSDDFYFTDLEISSDGNAGVSYADVTESSAFVKNAAIGYGLNVSAAKSESSTAIQVSWERPYENDSGVPYIYRRLYGSSDNWSKIKEGNIDTTVFNDELSDMDKTKAYEYAVQYHTSTADLSYKTAYAEHLQALDERYSDVAEADYEELNKGYLFYMDFSASYNGTVDSDGTYKNDENYYSEKVSHTLWNFDERKRGPKTYTISAMNQNTSMGYVKLADIAVDSSTGEETFTLNASDGILTDDTSSDTKIVKSGSSLILSPIGLTAGSANYTDGILKVLRAAKTYYKLDSSLEYSKSDETSGTAVMEEETYAYRQISNEELTKAAMLVLAYGFYMNDGGDSKYSNISSQFEYGGAGTQVGATGNAVFTSRESAWSDVGIGKYKQYYTFSSYGPLFYTPSGDNVTSPVKISCSQNSCAIKGNADNYIYKFRNTHDISVETCDTDIPLDYSATLNFSCTDNSTLKVTITRDSVTETMVDTSDNSTRKKWFPMQIHSDTSYELKSTTYGWWPAE